MRNLILGTAGHIDHGKTSLVKALTGIDTDRLREEKLRGISIDLGFAFLDVAPDVRLGIVDVPGHERFIKNMLAGVGGIDLVLFVVASDEGIMPQTQEHFDIVLLLGVRHGVFALTKTDLVDEDLIGLVRKEVEEMISDTPLKGAPIVPVSTKTGDGIDRIKEALLDVSRRIEEREAGSAIRLPIDRVFTVAGRGTVVTVTLWSGRIRSGSRLVIQPEGIEVRVRSIEVHGRPVELATAGQRTALGLHGVSREHIERGSCVVSPGDFEPTTLLDAEFVLLSSAPKPLRSGTRVRFHVAASEIMGRIFLSGSDKIEPGHKGFCQIKLEQPAVAAYMDRFVIRTYSPMRTIGGGRILDPLAERRKKVRAYESWLRRLAVENAEEAVLAHIMRRGLVGMPQLLPHVNTGSREVAGIIEQLLERGEVFEIASGVYVHRSRIEELQSRIEELLRVEQHKDRLKWGMSKEELRERLGRIDMALLNWTLARMQTQGRIHLRKGDVRIGTKEVELDPEEERARQAVTAALRSGGFQPPGEKELETEVGLAPGIFQKVVRLLIEDGRIVRLQPGILMHVEAIAEARSLVEAYLREHGKATVSELKKVLGTSRKYAVPLLEYLDRSGLTRRDASGVRTLVH